MSKAKRGMFGVRIWYFGLKIDYKQSTQCLNWN